MRVSTMTAAEALDAILARYGCAELVQTVRDEMERTAAFMQCSITAGGDLIAERDKLRDDLAAARAAIVHCRAHSGYLPGASDELLRGLLDSITRICDKALAGKDAP
jgi:hypothetical protein